jgi:hypothetical protein
MYVGKDLGVSVSALRGEFDITAVHQMATSFENQNHVVGGASTGAGEHHFHGPRCQIMAAAIRCAIHGGDMSGPCFGDKQHPFGTTPLHGAFHEISFNAYPIMTMITFSSPKIMKTMKARQEIVSYAHQQISGAL